MLEDSINAKQPITKMQNPNAFPLMTIIKEFNQQIQYLQARLASQLSFNSFLFEKANQLSSKNNKTTYAHSQTNVLNKIQSNQEIKRTEVKSQDFGAPSYLYQNYFLQNSQKKSNKTKEMFLEKDGLKTKAEINDDQKIQQKQQFQFGQVAERNQTKNIPKNYGKAMLSFIQRNIDKYAHVVKPILQKSKLTITDLLNHIKKHKKEVNSIHYLKLMWGCQDTNDPIFKCIRILSHIFMRKYCLYYIFNSRIKNYNTHIKYRRRMLEGIENPAEFTCIKQF